MNKLKLAGAFLLAALLGAVAWFAAMFRKQEEQRAKERVADELKAKVAEIHAQRAQEKAAADVAVAKVQEAAQKEKDRDAVDVANDLIADARAGSGERSKG